MHTSADQMYLKVFFFFFPDYGMDENIPVISLLHDDDNRPGGNVIFFLFL